MANRGQRLHDRVKARSLTSPHHLRRARARPPPSAPYISVSRHPRRAGVRPLDPSRQRGLESPRQPRRAVARLLSSAPGASAPRLPRRAGARLLLSASGASAPRLPRLAGARPPSTASGARVPRYCLGPGAHYTQSSKGPYPRLSAHGPRPTASQAQGPQSHSPSLRAVPSRFARGLTVTFQVAGRAQPQHLYPSRAAAQPSVASHVGPPYSGRWGQVPRIVPRPPGRSSRCSP